MDANSTVGAAGAVAMVIVGVLGLAILVFWIASPFMLYAINQKLLETNRLLALILERQQVPTPAAPPEDPAAPPMFRSFGA